MPMHAYSESGGRERGDDSAHSSPSLSVNTPPSAAGNTCTHSALWMRNYDCGGAALFHPLLIFGLLIPLFSPSLVLICLWRALLATAIFPPNGVGGVLPFRNLVLRLPSRPSFHPPAAKSVALLQCDEFAMLSVCLSALQSPFHPQQIDKQLGTFGKRFSSSPLPSFPPRPPESRHSSRLEGLESVFVRVPPAGKVERRAVIDGRCRDGSESEASLRLPRLGAEEEADALRQIDCLVSGRALLGAFIRRR